MIQYAYPHLTILYVTDGYTTVSTAPDTAIGPFGEVVNKKVRHAFEIIQSI